MTDQNDDLQSAWENLRRNADAGREPELISAQLGHRQVSYKALLEHIERQFIEEYAESDALRQADTATKRLKLLLGTVDYVLAVESVSVRNDDKAAIINAAYSNLFGYGPLDALLLDEHVTTISLEGADKAAVRHGHGDLESIGPLFEDEAHLVRILRRLLVDAGADLSDDLPFIETGLVADGRPVCISLFTPLMSFSYSADIRVHPKQPLSLDDLVERGFLTKQAAEILIALVKSPYGMVIVGDTEAGKTTLLSALAHHLDENRGVIAVERAGEMRLPETIERRVVRWPLGDEPGVTFGEQIALALEQKPACILLDEVRADEPESVAPLLDEPDATRQIWSFRGPFDSKRLRNALGMLARRADVGRGEALVNALYQRLPFIVTVWRANGQIRLYSIAEWQYRQSDYPDYIPLITTSEGELKFTGEKPAHELDLPGGFWVKT